MEAELTLRGVSKAGISLQSCPDSERVKGVKGQRGERAGALYPTWTSHWTLPAPGRVCDLGQGGSLQPRLSLLKLIGLSVGNTLT